jgi:hypothetical protein
VSNVLKVPASYTLKNQSIDFLIVFFVTLQSFYFYQIKLAPFPILGFLLVFFYGKSLTAKEILVFIAFTESIFILSIFVGIINTDGEVYVPSIIGFLLGPMYVLFFFNYFKQKKDALYNILGKVLLVHFLFFTAQFITFNTSGYYVDYVEPFTGEESRYLGTGALTGQARCTGLTVEPAMYCLVISIIVLSRLSIGGKLKLIDFFGLLSSFLSFSASGMVYCILFIIVNILFFNKNIFNKVLVLCFLVVLFWVIFVFFGDYYLGYYESRFLNLETDVSGQDRWVVGVEYFLNQKLVTQLFGLGIGNIFGDNTRGSGLTSIFTTLGFVFTILFAVSVIFILIRKKVKISIFILYAILLLGAIPINILMFWFLMSTVFLSGHYFMNREKKCAA